MNGLENVSAPAPSSNQPSPASTSPSAGNVTTSPAGKGSPSANPAGSSSQSQSTSGSSSPASSQPEMFEVKVNGQTVRMTRQEALDYASMGKAANEKFNEASRMRKEQEAFRENLKKDFIKSLQDPALGLSKDQIRAEFEKWYMREFIEPESLNEDQRRLRQAEMELKRYQEQEQEFKQRQEQEQLERMTAQQREHLQQQIIEAFEKSNLPKASKFALSRVAFYMRQNALNGWDAPMDLIMRQVQNERREYLRSEVDQCTPEQAIELLGEEFVNKIRKHDLERLRAKRNMPPASSQQSPSGVGPFNGERIYSDEVAKRLRDMRTGKISF